MVTSAPHGSSRPWSNRTCSCCSPTASATPGTAPDPARRAGGARHRHRPPCATDHGDRRASLRHAEPTHGRCAAPRRSDAGRVAELNGTPVPRQVRRRPNESWPRPRKRLGQHFLNDPQILGDIADALAPGDTDTVVEIGPGRGALTALLAARAGRVAAVELDTALAERLRATYADDPRVTRAQPGCARCAAQRVRGHGRLSRRWQRPVLHHDTDPLPCAPRATRAARGLPRAARSRGSGDRRSGVRGLWRAVGQRAGAGEAKMLFMVPPGAFAPPPTVDSAALLVTPRSRSDHRPRGV